MAFDPFVPGPDTVSILSRPRGRPRKGQEGFRKAQMWAAPPGEIAPRPPSPCATSHQPRIIAANDTYANVIYRCVRPGCGHRWQEIQKRR